MLWPLGGSLPCSKVPCFLSSSIISIKVEYENNSFFKENAQSMTIKFFLIYLFAFKKALC